MLEVCGWLPLTHQISTRKVRGNNEEQVWRLRPSSQALKRWIREDREFVASLSYTKKPGLKKIKRKFSFKKKILK